MNPELDNLLENWIIFKINIGIIYRKIEFYCIEQKLHEIPFWEIML